MSHTQNSKVFYNRNLIKCMPKDNSCTSGQRNEESIIVEKANNSTSYSKSDGEGEKNKKIFSRRNQQNRGRGRGRGGYITPSETKENIQVNEPIKAESKRGRGGHNGRGRERKYNYMQRKFTQAEGDLNERKQNDNIKCLVTEKYGSKFDELSSQKDYYFQERSEESSQKRQTNEPYIKNVKKNYEKNGDNDSKDQYRYVRSLNNDKSDWVETDTAKNNRYKKYQLGNQRGSFTQSIRDTVDVEKGACDKRSSSQNRSRGCGNDKPNFRGWGRKRKKQERRENVDVEAFTKNTNEPNYSTPRGGTCRGRGGYRGRSRGRGSFEISGKMNRVINNTTQPEISLTPDAMIKNGHNQEEQKDNFGIETFTNNTKDPNYLSPRRGTYRGRRGYRGSGRGRFFCEVSCKMNSVTNNTTQPEISSTANEMIKNEDTRLNVNVLQMETPTITKNPGQLLQNKSQGHSSQNIPSQPTLKLSSTVVEKNTHLLNSNSEDNVKQALFKDKICANANSASKSSISTTKAAPKRKIENIQSKTSLPRILQNVTKIKNCTATVTTSTAAGPNNTQMNHSVASIPSLAAFKTVSVQSLESSTASSLASQQNMPPTVSNKSQFSLSTNSGLAPCLATATKGANTNSSPVSAANAGNPLRKQWSTNSPMKTTSPPKSIHRTVVSQVSKKKLSFQVTDSCKLVIKSYGNVTIDDSDVIVSFLDTGLDLKSTATGQAILRVSPNHEAEIKECYRKGSSSYLVSKYYPRTLNCLAICHALHNAWMPDFSEKVFHTQLNLIFDVVKKVQAETISFPPLSCDYPFYFSAKTVVPSFLYFLSHLNIEKCLSKIVVHATMSNVFQEFECLAPFYLNRTNESKLLFSLPLQRNTLSYLNIALKSDKIFPSYWSLNGDMSIENKETETSIENKETETSIWGMSLLKNIVSAVSSWFTGESVPDFNFKEAKLVDVNNEIKIVVTNLVNRTLHQNVVGHGADAIGVRYSSFKILDVKRIENPTLFERYHTSRKRVMEKMIRKGHVCTSIGTLVGSKGNVVTWDSLPDSLKKELYSEINEHYLFHGTNTSAVHSIVEHGFDLKYSNEWCLFGKGIYFAEKAMKSDQYTDKHFRRPNGTKLTMIMTRILLGNAFVCDESHKKVSNLDPKKRFKKPPCMSCHDDLCYCGNRDYYDSVMGDGKWLFREFVVYDASQCYPEFLITYERV
uniref:Poly [ADP-ribose] polymerase n=1 Tax=Biomphalaria glabrata TaxID=6526 RepID=A0A182YU59_BIOGL